MTRRAATTSGIIAAAACLSLMLGCGKSDVETAGGDQTSAGGMPEASANSVAGIRWNLPDDWQVGHPRPMRVVTYTIGTGAEMVECAVFFFGEDQGGSLDDNLERWISQFEQPDGSESMEKALGGVRTVDGMMAATIDLSGTYTGDMADPTPKPGYRLLGAIVTAPQGPVFFKMVGPARAVNAAGPAFERLINSVKEL